MLDVAHHYSFDIFPGLEEPCVDFTPVTAGVAGEVEIEVGEPVRDVAGASEADNNAVEAS